MMNDNVRAMKDDILKQWWADLIDANWPQRESEPHLVNVIAQSRGWKPLVPGETMTVTFSGSRYTITRGETLKP